MGVLTVKVQPAVTGPLGDGAVAKLAQDWATAVSQALGDEAVAMLGAWPFTGGKAGVGRDSSGRYVHREGASRSQGGFRSSLRVVRKSPAEVSVPGPMIKGVAWSPWLEGTSQRNTTTGFKGYHLFRTTRAALDKSAPEIGQRVLGGMLPGMGGG